MLFIFFGGFATTHMWKTLAAISLPCLGMASTTHVYMVIVEFIIGVTTI